jgi:hypothetical protein
MKRNQTNENINKKCVLSNKLWILKVWIVLLFN